MPEPQGSQKSRLKSHFLQPVARDQCVFGRSPFKVPQGPTTGHVYVGRNVCGRKLAFFISLCDTCISNHDKCHDDRRRVMFTRRGWHGTAVVVAGICIRASNAHAERSLPAACSALAFSREADQAQSSLSTYNTRACVCATT